MPRISSAPSDARQGGFGIQEGDWEIKEACFRVHQYPANKQGEQSSPFLAFRLGMAKLDEDLDIVDDDAELEYQEWAILWSKREDYQSSGEINLGIHPGNCDGMDDEDAEDACEDGVEVGVEGNTLYAEDATKTPFKDSDYIRLMNSFSANGVKDDILNASYAPYFVGMKVRVRTDELPKPKNWKKEANPTVLLVDKIHEFPGGKAGKKKAGKASASKSNAKAKPEPDTEEASDSDEGSEALAVFTSAVEKLNKKVKGKALSRSDFQKKIMLEIQLLKPPLKIQREVMGGIKDDDWLSENGAQAGVIVDLDEGQVDFA